MSTPASSATTALGWSYAVIITIGSPSARISASLVSVTGLGTWSLRGGEDMGAPFVVGAGSAGRHRGSYGFEQDVVDQADAADAGGHGQQGGAFEACAWLERLGVDEREILGLEAGGRELG